MAVLKVNPTRMELRNLKSRLAIASRGHTLLKEKQDSLIQEFMRLSEEARVLRRQVEAQFVRVHESYRRVSLVGDDAIIQKSLMNQEHNLNVGLYRDHVLSLRVPRFEIDAHEVDMGEYSLFALSKDIDDISEEYKDLLPKLIELTQLEKTCFMLAGEIKATRRRVNALEYRTIPDIRDTIAFIAMKIDDHERSQKARVMKVK